MYTKLISVKTQAIFDAIQQSNNPFPTTSVVIIEDTKRIWTHGIFINGISISGSQNSGISITGADNTYSLDTYYHKKRQDLDLGTYTREGTQYIQSYVLKAGTHKLIRYTEQLQDYTGIHIGEDISNLFINSKNQVKRYYINGVSTYTYTMLDTTNLSIGIQKNKLTCTIAGTANDFYLARHDTSIVLPENDLSNKYSRLGGSSVAGWIVMNTSTQGDGDYYALKIINTSSTITSPSFYIKPAAESTYTKVLLESDVSVFTGASIGQNNTVVAGTSGLVPAPTDTGLFLRSDATWSSIFPTPVSNSFLHTNSNGQLEWATAGSESLIGVTLTGVSLTTQWTNIDNLTNRQTMDNGSYIVQITYGSCIYTGIFSYAVNGYDIDDEIILHCSGSNDTIGGETRGRLYAKISSNNNIMFLQLSASRQEDNATLVIKYKKLI